MKKLIIYCSLFIIPLTSAQAEGYFCSINASEDSSHFFCLDEKEKTIVDREVEPIFESSFRADLEDKGVSFIGQDELVMKAMNVGVDAVNLKELLICSSGQEIEEKVKYEINEFNALSTNHGAIDHLKILAAALHKAGICDLPIKNNNLDINDKDDLIKHFLCISNSESVFGRNNIGMGGRGPWGIHPMHNQRKGTKAYSDGEWKTLPSDGVCYPSKAIVRDKNEVEIKKSDLYRDKEVIQANANCAMTLYKLNGLSDWGGSSSKWGSNRHCKAKTRNAFKFGKYLGELSCCTQACKDKVSKSTSL